MVNLGVATDLRLRVRSITVTETVTVTAVIRYGLQLGAHRRRDVGEPQRIAVLPTFSGRINDLTRLTPQATGCRSPARTIA